jgi:N-acetylmuramoyl-L-alanine amidase
MNSSQMYEFVLLALCVWRESRGELLSTKQAVAWSIRNRVAKPCWWGHSWDGVILMPKQYSSFNHSDPNATRFPLHSDISWQESLLAAQQVYGATAAIADPTMGATSYFDCSLDSDPPSWSYDGSNVHTVDFGRLHFYRLVA